MAKIVKGIKYYPITERWLFGLESMRDKCTYWLTCESEKFTEKEIEEIERLQDECENLLWKVRSGWADGKTLERIKEITYTREQIRFDTCVNNGMPYQYAAPALRGL